MARTEATGRGGGGRSGKRAATTKKSGGSRGGGSSGGGGGGELLSSGEAALAGAAAVATESAESTNEPAAESAPGLGTEHEESQTGTGGPRDFADGTGDVDAGGDGAQHGVDLAGGQQPIGTARAALDAKRAEQRAAGDAEAADAIEALRSEHVTSTMAALVAAEHGGELTQAQARDGLRDVATRSAQWALERAAEMHPEPADASAAPEAVLLDRTAAAEQLLGEVLDVVLASAGPVLRAAHVSEETLQADFLAALCELEERAVVMDDAERRKAIGEARDDAEAAERQQREAAHTAQLAIDAAREREAALSIAGAERGARTMGALIARLEARRDRLRDVLRTRQAARKSQLAALDDEVARADELVRAVNSRIASLTEHKRRMGDELRRARTAAGA